MSDIFQWSSIYCDSTGLSKGASACIWWLVQRAALINYILKRDQGWQENETVQLVLYNYTALMVSLTGHQTFIECAHDSKRSCHPLSQERRGMLEKNDLNQSQSWVRIRTEYLPGQGQGRERIMCRQ